MIMKNIVLKNVKLEGEIDDLHKRFDKYESEEFIEGKIRAILFRNKDLL